MKKTDYEVFQNKQYKVRQVDNIRTLILTSADIYHKKPAFVMKEEEGLRYISYTEYRDDYSALCAYLHANGYIGKPIAVIGANCYEWALAYAAAVTVGLVVPLDKELASEDIIDFLNASESVMVIADEKSIEKISAGKQNLINKQTVLVDMHKKKSDNATLAGYISEGRKLHYNGHDTAMSMPIDAEEDRIILFTSGTTGNAKGVCLSHKNIVSNIMSVSRMVKIHSSDRVLSILPLHHTYEATLGYLTIIYNGGSISYCDGLRYIYKNIGDYHPSVVVTVPLLLEKISAKLETSVREGLPSKHKTRGESLSFSELLASLPFYIRKVIKTKAKNAFGGRIRMFIVGAAAIDKEIVDQLGLLDMRTLQGYGLTECSPLLAGNNDFFLKSDSTGFPIDGVELRIYEPNEEGAGEIIARGDNIMNGYYRDDEATQTAIVDGWFHTGDLGYIDENGYVYITGRKKSVIVTKNGKNIYPEEIEHRLNNTNLVAESLVVGSNDKSDDVYVKAKIYPNIDAIKDLLQVAAPTKEEITEAIKNMIEELNDKLPSYKRIKDFIIRDTEFEKTTTQKIKRFGKNTE